MMSAIVEKIVIDDRTGRRSLFAVATSEPNTYSVLRSLTFEAYLTPWSANRGEVETLQRQIEES